MLSAEIASLGAIVSKELVSQGQHVMALQAFDYLSQQARAYGELLKALGRGDEDGDALQSTVISIPLPAVRQRLAQALFQLDLDDPSEDSEMWG